MEFLVPIAICAILPISIVLVVFLASMYSEKKRAQVLIKAIEANNSIDADKLADALRKPKKTALEILNRRLLWGCIFSLIGIALLVLGFIDKTEEAMEFFSFGGLSLALGASFLIVYFATRKQVTDQKED